MVALIQAPQLLQAWPTLALLHLTRSLSHHHLGLAYHLFVRNLLVLLITTKRALDVVMLRCIAVFWHSHLRAILTVSLPVKLIGFLMPNSFLNYIILS